MRDPETLRSYQDRGLVFMTRTPLVSFERPAGHTTVAVSPTQAIVPVRPVRSEGVDRSSAGEHARADSSSRTAVGPRATVASSVRSVFGAAVLALLFAAGILVAGLPIAIALRAVVIVLGWLSGTLS